MKIMMMMKLKKRKKERDVGYLLSKIKLLLSFLVENEIFILFIDL